MFGMFNDNFMSIRFDFCKGITKKKILNTLERIKNDSGLEIEDVLHMAIKIKSGGSAQCPINKKDITNEELATLIVRVLDSNEDLKSTCVTIDVHPKRELLDINNAPISLIYTEEFEKINSEIDIRYYTGSMFTSFSETQIKKVNFGKKQETSIENSKEIHYEKNKNSTDNEKKYKEKSNINNNTKNDLKIMLVISSVNDYRKKEAYKYILKSFVELQKDSGIIISKIKTIELNMHSEDSLKKIYIDNSENKSLNLSDMKEVAKFVVEKIATSKEDVISVSLEIEIENPLIDFEGNNVKSCLIGTSNYLGDDSYDSIVYGITYVAEVDDKLYKTEIKPILDIEFDSKFGLPNDVICEVLKSLQQDVGLKIKTINELGFYTGDNYSAVYINKGNISNTEIARKIKLGTHAHMFVNRNKVHIKVEQILPILDEDYNPISHIHVDMNSRMDVYIWCEKGFVNKEKTNFLGK